MKPAAGRLSRDGVQREYAVAYGPSPRFRARAALIAGIAVAATVALLGLGRLGPFAIPPAGAGSQAGFRQTVHFGAFRIALRAMTIDGSGQSYRVTVHARVTNDSVHVATRLEAPVLTAEGLSSTGTARMPAVDLGASTDATFLYAGYQVKPDLSHAVLTFGDRYTQQAVVPVDDRGFTSLMPVAFPIQGSADTGPDETHVSFASGELRADWNGTEARRGQLFLVVHFAFGTGKDYTNGAAHYWDASDLDLFPPGGDVIHTDFGNTQDPCPRCAAAFTVPEAAPGSYRVVNDYKVYGKTNGQVTFAVPGFGPRYEPFIMVSPNSLDGAQGGSHDLGALDFVNQTVGTASDDQYVTVTNSGPGTLRIQGVIASPGFVVDGNDDSCSGVALTVGERCRFPVYFQPSTTGPVLGRAMISDDAPESPHAVSLSGVGTAVGVRKLSVEESATSLGPIGASCNGALYGYGLVDSARAVATLTGQVVAAHQATTDFTLVHNAFDYNFFVYPDNRSKDLLSRPGNFHGGDDYEFGRIEVEWETETGRSVGGFPSWAWPQQGDRVFVAGNHIADCGHGLEVDPFVASNYRAEIHPPRFVAVYRNAALGTFAGGTGRLGSTYRGERATRVDLFGSSYGGVAIKSAGGGGDYQPFDVYQIEVDAPPRPSADAQLQLAVVPRGTPGSRGTVTADKLPVTSRYQREGYRLTVDVPGGGAQPMTAGETVYVYWSGSPAVVRPVVRQATVTFLSLTTQQMTGDLAFHAYVNGESRTLMIGSPTDSLGMPYVAGVHDHELLCATGLPILRGCRFRLVNNVFQEPLVEGQPLHVEVRGIALRDMDLPVWTGRAFIAGTVEQIIAGAGVDGAVGRETVQTLPSSGAMAVGGEAVDAGCDSCFQVTYRVDVEP